MKLTTITEINPKANMQEMESQLDYIAHTIAFKIGEYLAEESVKRMKNEIEKQLDNKFQVNIIVQKRAGFPVFLAYKTAPFSFEPVLKTPSICLIK